MAIVEVVKFNGTPDMFAWKFPSEELANWTQLIVAETQEAILFKGGRALDVFGPGRHTLDTQNIPLLNRIINLPFGGRSPFTAEVWFVNKVVSLDVKWGTSTPIQLQDPKYGIFVPLRSFGQFGVRVSDSKKFLLKLVGTLPMLDQSSLLKFFRGLYLTKVKDTLSSYLVHKKIGILEINAYLNELSEYMAEQVKPMLDEYGIALVNFFVNDISVPEDDPAVIKLKEALAKRAEMDIIGYNYQQERSFDTLEGAARNPGSTASGVMGAGIGLGLGAGVGQAFGGQMGGISSHLNTNAGKTLKCPRCDALVEEGKRFCPDCGADMSSHESKEIKCQNCGAVLDPKAKFCAECGDRYNPCPNCAADIHPDAASCPHCGYRMPTPCPACGQPVPSGVKFCPECGKSLAKQCPKCGHAMTGNPKFCPECGERLDQGQPDQGTQDSQD